MNTKTKTKTINFLPLAFIKMVLLINCFSDEVGWHGTVHQDSDSKFTITDILVYPQKVSSVLVDTDQNEYQTWLYALNDEQFNLLRMHGHSHVNMCPKPSITDFIHQKGIVKQLENGMFYIFLIWNKSLDFTATVYEVADNQLLSDNNVVIMVDGYKDLYSFMTEAKKLVRKQKPKKKVKITKHDLKY